METLLAVKNLSVEVRSGTEEKRLLRDVSFELRKGSCLGILGESGSGKSLTCKSVMGLLGPEYRVSGTVAYKGRDLLSLRREEMRALRGSGIAMILQNPMTAFDPLLSIGSQMVETVRQHGPFSPAEARRRSLDALTLMGLRHPDDVFRQYAHQLSGGMLQRVMIGLALLLGPDLIIADEPTTALDTVTQDEILKEFDRVRRERRCSVLFVSHDLGVLARIADDLLVMDRGEVIEQGDLRRICSAPRSRRTGHLFDTRLMLLDAFRKATTPREERSRHEEPLLAPAATGF
ncbi:ABC transporter ATP-binding protein [Aminirod propionatiphilus]|uniref:ABC transporter ATP-binding protein n=1 Tax=Aminirod propionatiphilus TaxID=3415223 RepID=A0ACD1DW70_9BACT|nr:ABC transporter ATP-binding protein [Synergistota bacterium]